jgi:hypothetical protein
VDAHAITWLKLQQANGFTPMGSFSKFFNISAEGLHLLLSSLTFNNFQSCLDTSPIPIFFSFYKY